ncbi:MAG: SpoIIE family protein phosphatase [Pirellulaceae bacterium]|jgi:serine phosphatase RsbU (regulator of sigma subunit)|nr:SpoIIE family protein phosphatase [Pirellulaceae bacterium]
MPEAYLSEENGPNAGNRIHVTSGVMTLGRRGVDIRIDDRHVSQLHAQISFDGDACYVTDLGSRNKTAVNGRELDAQHPQRLNHGDRITIARVREFVFHCCESSTSGPPVEWADDASDSDSTVHSMLDVDSGSASASATVSAEVKLGVLFDITRQLGKKLTLDAVLPKVLDSLFRVFPQADRGFIVLTDDQGRLVPRWTKTRRPSDDSIRISQTVIRQVLESKQAQLREVMPGDVQASESLHGIGFLVCAPLLDSNERAIGVIHLDTLHRRKPFKREDMELLASVAIQAGMTIENAQFHETVVQLQKIELDVQLANEVQRAFLPKGPPTFADYGFFDYYNAARQVGGDYYDYVQLPDGRTAMIVADVAGKGVAAALVMARVSAEAKFCLATEPRPGAAMNRLNDRLCLLQIDRFVTMVILVLDPRTHQVTIVNAGHMPPIWRRADGTVEEPGRETSSMALGIVPGIEYLEAVISLGPGESLTMYTDGVTDATDANGKDFQARRVLDHVKIARRSARDLGQAIISDLQQFIGNHPQTDDICLVCVARLA